MEEGSKTMYEFKGAKASVEIRGREDHVRVQREEGGEGGRHP